LSALAAPPLLPGEIHVWRLGLDGAPDDEALLSEAERARAARFRFADHRDRYVAAHAGLRRVLAAYLDVPPASLAFAAGDGGKPALPGTLRFNLSHSDACALVAVAREREVGVDVERLRAVPEALSIARRYFSDSEAASLLGCEGEARDRAFFTLWTRKEALLKLRGLGLSALDRAHVGPDVSVESFEVGPGFLGAVAADAAAFTLVRLAA
jgi:4'-phosphopantetheinyl transferase